MGVGVGGVFGTGFQSLFPKPSDWGDVAPSVSASEALEQVRKQTTQAAVCFTVGVLGGVWVGV